MPPSVPTPGELARTALARARVAALTTYPRRAPGRPRLTSAAVTDDAGAALVRVAAGSPAAAELALRPLATVTVRPEGCRTVTLQGAARRVPGQDLAGLAAFRVEAGAVRLGRGEPVAVQEYLSARPDPLRDDAPAVLAHLRAGLGGELAACLRVHGHPRARWAEPVRLDRYGLELVALDDTGAEVVRLAFPRPLERLSDLEPGLLAVLAPPGRSRA